MSDKPQIKRVGSGRLVGQTGAEMIAAERHRQMSAEGWTPEHDKKHRGKQLAKAASSYLATHAEPDVDHPRSPHLMNCEHQPEGRCAECEAKYPAPQGCDDEHHAMMNGPRVAQSLPPEYLNALIRASCPNVVVSHTGALPDAKISNQAPSPGVGL